MGSPSAVPVPCASSETTTATSWSFVAQSRERYEAPFGAVKLALGPSCQIAVAMQVDLLQQDLKTKEIQPSPRQ